MRTATTVVLSQSTRLRLKIHRVEGVPHKTQQTFHNRVQVQTSGCLTAVTNRCALIQASCHAHHIRWIIHSTRTGSTGLSCQIKYPDLSTHDDASSQHVIIMRKWELYGQFTPQVYFNEPSFQVPWTQRQALLNNKKISTNNTKRGTATHTFFHTAICEIINFGYKVAQVVNRTMKTKRNFSSFKGVPC